MRPKKEILTINIDPLSDVSNHFFFKLKNEKKRKTKKM